jgi:hypothetical protein
MVDVAVPVVDSTTMPCKVPANTPLRTDTWLLLMLLVNVPVGATEKDGTKMPLNVPELVPPLELSTVLKEML